MNRKQIEDLIERLTINVNTTIAHSIVKWSEQNATEQYSVDWEDVSGNADFIVHKMEMYDTEGKLVQCVNLNTQYRPKPTSQRSLLQWKLKI